MEGESIYVRPYDKTTKTYALPMAPVTANMRGVLAECFTTGECGGCGLCCMGHQGFDIPHTTDIIRASGQPGYLSMEKQGITCPYIRETEAGESHCSVQKLKEHDRRLRVCLGWKGNDSDNAENLLGNVAILLTKAPSQEFLEHFIIKYIKPGVFEGLEDRMREHFGRLIIRNWKIILQWYLQVIEYLPEPIFDIFDLKGTLEKMTNKKQGTLMHNPFLEHVDKSDMNDFLYLILDQENSVHRRFVEKYAPGHARHYLQKKWRKSKL